MLVSYMPLAGGSIPRSKRQRSPYIARPLLAVTESCAKTAVSRMRKSITVLAAALLPCTDALQLTRRQLAGAAAVFAPTAARADVPVDPFNSMCLGFGCNSPQGVDSPGAPAPTDEDSIPWKQALELIEAKKVKSVEFNDVAMDKCWVVTSDGRFRVGEGYP